MVIGASTAAKKQPQYGYTSEYTSPEERGTTYHHRPDIQQFIHEEVAHLPHKDISPNSIKRRSKDQDELMEAMEGEMEAGRMDFDGVRHMARKAEEAAHAEEEARMYQADPDAPEVDLVGPIGSPLRKGVYSLPTRAPEQRFPLNLHALPVVRGPAGKRENARTVADVYGSSFGVQVGNKQSGNAPKHTYNVVGLGTAADCATVGIL